MKIEQRRRLTDLYSRGEVFPINDGSGEPIVLWIRKMTPADAEISYLKASAKRASFLAMGKEDPPSDAYVTLRAEVEDFSKENLIVWATATRMIKVEPQVEARISFKDEWEKERYLFSLQERSVDADFRRKVEENPEDEEVLRVTKELSRFQGQITKELAKERAKVEREMDDYTHEELCEMVLQSMLESQADQAWLNEFQKCQIWRCVFNNDNRSQRCFQTRDEVDDLQTETIAALAEVIERVHVPDAEGKDSQQTPDSSAVSE
jgi:hypothetical protein